MTTKFFTVYRITNQIDGKFYIGRHKTANLNDGYFGSGGTRLQAALAKYGRENFTKEIIMLCDSYEHMIQVEKDLVILDPAISYNMVPGGDKGGWVPTLNKGRIRTPEHKLAISRANKGSKRTQKQREAISKANIGRQFSAEHKEKLKLSAQNRGPRSSESIAKSAAGLRGRSWTLVDGKRKWLERN